MGLDLRELIMNPGARLPFRHESGAERLAFPAVLSYVEPPVGEGVIANDAGALTLRGELRARLRCVCDRCAGEYETDVRLPLEVKLATELEDEEDPDFFLLDGDTLDMDELLETCFILGMDSRFLCKPDCRGLCPRCGANLNEGTCGCAHRREPDPRLAVLEQLLDDKE